MAEKNGLEAESSLFSFVIGPDETLLCLSQKKLAQEKADRDCLASLLLVHVLLLVVVDPYSSS